MPKKTYKIKKNTLSTVSEPAVAYLPKTAKTLSFPNVPFHGTQEEWLEYFCRIEEGTFYPVSETHQRIAQWLDSQKK